MKMFFVAGIGLALFLEFLLLSKKNKSAADKILTVWIILIAGLLSAQEDAQISIASSVNVLPFVTT